MTRARLAPELSATLTIDSCWIIASSPRPRSARALDDLDHAPPLVLRQRAGLHNPHPITDLRRVLLVVRLKLRGPRHHLAVHRMRHASLDRDDYRFLHLVADHHANARLPRPARRRSRRVRHLCHRPRSSPIRLASTRGAGTTNARFPGTRRQLALAQNRLQTRDVASDR